MHIYTKQNLTIQIKHKELEFGVGPIKKRDGVFLYVNDYGGAVERKPRDKNPFFQFAMTPTEADYIGRKLIHFAEIIRENQKKAQPEITRELLWKVFKIDKGPD